MLHYFFRNKIIYSCRIVTIGESCYLVAKTDILRGNCGMVRFISYIIMTAVMLVVLVSAFMNYEFVSHRVGTPLYGMMLGSVMIALDIIKSFCPIIIMRSLNNKKYISVFVTTAIFIPLVLFSILTAFGFAASNINVASTGKASITEQYTDIKDDIDRIMLKLKAQPQARTVEAVQQDIRASEQHKRYSSSRQCSDATARKSKDFCTHYFGLKSELAVAHERARLEHSLQALKLKKTRLLTKGAKLDSDPQAGFIARLTGLRIKDVQSGIAAFLSLILEAVAALGFYIATAHGDFVKSAKAVPGKQRHRQEAKREDVVDVVCGVSAPPARKLVEHKPREIKTLTQDNKPREVRTLTQDNKPRKVRTLTPDNKPENGQPQKTKKTKPRRLTVAANGALTVI